MTSSITLHQQCRRLAEGDTQTPIRLFMQLSRSNPEAILLESAEVDGRWGRYSIIATDYLAEFLCRGGKLEVKTHRDDLAPLRELSGQPYMDGMRRALDLLHIEPEEPELAPITRALYGYWGYEMATVFQPKLAQTLNVADAESHLVLAATVLVFDHVYNRLYQLSLGEHRDLVNMEPLSNSHPRPFSIGPVSYCPDEETYKKGVETVRQLLHDGEAIQVVASSRGSAPFEGDTFTLYRRLRSLNPSPYMFYMRFNDLELFGASPEVMVQCTGGHLLLAPIAGTRKRGRNAAEDEALADDMQRDPKERAEHLMLIDLARNDIGRIAKPGTVKVTESYAIERYSQVQHLVSNVEGELSDGMDNIDVLRAAFPAGTLTGAPKVRAMEIIDELEPVARGIYGGAVGYLSFAGDMDLAIAIRTAVIKDKRLYAQAAAGIVADSIPEMEYNETEIKARAVLRAAELTETGLETAL